MRSHPVPQPRYHYRSMPGSLLDHPLFEPVLLRTATRRAQAFSDEARVRMALWLHAARARYHVALELRDAETQGVALGLLRESAFLTLRALEAARSEPISDAPSNAWAKLAARPDGAPSSLCRARPLLAADEPLAVEAPEVRELRPAAEETVAWLLSLAEGRSPKALNRLRWLRGAGLSVGLLLVIWALVAYWLTLASLATQTI